MRCADVNAHGYILEPPSFMDPHTRCKTRAACENIVKDVVVPDHEDEGVVLENILQKLVVDGMVGPKQIEDSTKFADMTIDLIV
jgi:hypothetical protein